MSAGLSVNPRGRQRDALLGLATLALVAAAAGPSAAATSEEEDFEVDSSRPEDYIGTREEVESNVTDDLATKLRQFDEWTNKTADQTAADAAARSASGGGNSSGQGDGGAREQQAATELSRRTRRGDGDANTHARPASESRSTRIFDREDRAALPTSSHRRNNPSEEDDVARILRRAAERETDPVRKRELMKQYDEYMRSQ